jgi:metallo-beta-lactamase family protein
VQSTEESAGIHDQPDPKIIIAGAGMSVGGRIRSHERALLGDTRTTLMFVGYQTPGSLGRKIQDGITHVEIDGERVRVRARIETLTGYSGHPDRDQLLDFVERADDRLSRVFVTMGEPQSSLFLAQRIRDFLNLDTVVPKHGETFTLDV